jgi:hypothetical protein
MQRGWIPRLLAPVALSTLAVLTAPGVPPAAAGKRADVGLTVERTAPLRADGTEVSVNGRIACAAGEQVMLSVVLRQGRGERATEGADYELVDCAGGKQGWTVVIDGQFPEQRAKAAGGPSPRADINGGPYRPGPAKAAVTAYEWSGAWQATAKGSIRLVKTD